MDMKDLKIIVTGAASGMGRHFALRLAECGGAVGGPSDIEAHSDDDSVASGNALRQDPCQLAAAEEDVVRPFQPDQRSAIGADEPTGGGHGRERDPGGATLLYTSCGSAMRGLSHAPSSMRKATFMLRQHRS